MAEIKNFGLTGVGPDLQLGKGGPRLKVNGSSLEAHTSDGVTLTRITAANAISGSDVVTLSQLNAAAANAGVADGFHLMLGNVATYGDGSWTGGAVSLTDATKVSDAVDSLNEVLGKLVPSAPPNFPNATALTITGTSGNSPLLASGAADNTGGTSGLSAGASVQRITTATVASNLFNDMGPGESGTVSLFINGSSVGSRTLTGSGDGGVYGGLTINDQKDFPVSTPGFWKSIDLQVTAGAVPTGIDGMSIHHSGAGNTNTVNFVRDNLNTAPTLASPTLIQTSAGTVAYSSSIPHYNTGATLQANATINNLSGQTYYGGTDPITVTSTNAILGTQTYTFANLGITLPITANNTSATAITPITINVNPSNVHNSGTVSATPKNVAGSGSALALSGSTILVKNGTTSRVDELSIPVSGLGSSPNNNNGIRVGQATGNAPVLANTTWVSSAAINTWDATVVGGALKNDTTNYSTGFFPVGPNLSTQGAAQYATFSFNRTALSQFKITVTGTYAGVWIGLPGVSDNSGVSPNAVGGAWWNAFVPYAGAGVPGGTGELTAGCASGSVMNGASGAFQITFGTASSTSATGNQILVRIRLNAGQSITALSFSN